MRLFRLDIQMTSSWTKLIYVYWDGSQTVVWEGLTETFIENLMSIVGGYGNAGKA